MSSMSYDKWQHLNQHFETADLLAAVDLLDKLSNTLGDNFNGEQLDLRRNLLRLHQLTQVVVDQGITTKAQEMFDLASALDTEVSDLIESLAAIQQVLSRLNAQRPDGLTPAD